MNTLGYLLLIAVLLLLAGAMLYARFASRSREKSSHHAPVDWSLPSVAVPVEEESPEAEKEQEPFLRLGCAAKQEPSDERDRMYLDELQEADAGLAKLIRSSPVERTEPVIFAPELVEEAVVEAEEVAETMAAIAAEETLEFEPFTEEAAPPRTLRELLGDAVAEQFDRVDAGLEALASLVTGIESGFAALDSLEREAVGKVEAMPEDVAVAA